MQRNVTLVGSLVIALALVGCGSSSGTDSGNPTDSGSGTDAGNTDAGFGGTLTVVQSGVALPTPWMSISSADFNPTDNGAASVYLNSLVQLNIASTTTDNPCPESFIYKASTGTTYCNGFQANLPDGGGEVLVDTYSQLSSTQQTACQASFAGSAPTAIRGIWLDYYNSQATPTDSFTIALTDCSDMEGLGGNGGSAYTGSGTAPSLPTGSQTVNTLLTGGAGNGIIVTVSGVITSVWSSGTEFGFTMQDPGVTTTSQSGISGSKGDKSTSTSTAPAIGDYVTVTGIFKTYTMPNTQEIDL
jgi:hypothetical protein